MPPARWITTRRTDAGTRLVLLRYLVDAAALLVAPAGLGAGVLSEVALTSRATVFSAATATSVAEAE
ncbi:MAG: hypothetical protein AB7G93_09745 [Bdellovibrionales bacterium]